MRQFDERTRPDAQDRGFLPEPSAGRGPLRSPRGMTLIYEVRGKTRDRDRARAHGPHSPPMGFGLTDASDRLAGRAEICIFCLAGLLGAPGRSSSEGDPTHKHKMPLKGFKLPELRVNLHSSTPPPPSFFPSRQFRLAVLLLFFRSALHSPRVPPPPLPPPFAPTSPLVYLLRRRRIELSEVSLR